MRIVHHDLRTVLLCKPDNLRQVRDIAAHAEHAVCHDEDTRRVRHLLKLPFQILHVVVTIPQHLAIGQPAPVIDARMVFPIADHIVVPPDDGADDAEVGLESGRKGHGRLHPDKFCKLFLQLHMHIQRPVQKARTRAPRAVFFQCLDACLDHAFVGREAQIVVGAEHDAPLALHNDLRPLPRLQFVEVGVDVRFPHLFQKRDVHFCKKIH